MLSRGDDYPVHQTADPIAHVGTGDRNYYDRYFFNGYDRDGEIFFAAALGVYPNRGVMDAAVSAVHAGKQVVVRASRLAPIDRVETTVGPITVQVIEPLRRLRLRLRENTWGLTVDATFAARAPAIEEPRFSRRAGPRTVMDYTRLTQHGTWEGRLEIGGKAFELSPDKVWGSRDRSWGIRPLGEPESGAPMGVPQFFWLWAPINFPDWVTQFDVNEEADGTRWHELGALARVGSEDAGAIVRAKAVEHRLTWRRGTRHAEKAEIDFQLGDRLATIELEPLFPFYMSGLGYLHPTWGHGTFHGAEEVAGESFLLSEVNEAAPLYLHVQAVCKARLSGHGGSPQKGIGVLEQLVLGDHAPTGLRGIIDGAS